MEVMSNFINLPTLFYIRAFKYWLYFNWLLELSNRTLNGFLINSWKSFANVRVCWVCWKCRSLKDWADPTLASIAMTCLLWIPLSSISLSQIVFQIISSYLIFQWNVCERWALDESTKVLCKLFFDSSQFLSHD